MKLLSSASPVTRDQPPARRGLAAMIHDWTASTRRRLSFAVTATMGRNATEAVNPAESVAAQKPDVWSWLAEHRKRGAAAAPVQGGQPARSSIAAAPPMTADEREVADMTDGPVADARGRERARCEAIMTSEAGLRFPKQAAMLAFDTRMTRAEALQTLALVAAWQPGPGVEQRRPLRHLGGRDASPSVETIAASWDRAMQRGAGQAAH